MSESQGLGIGILGGSMLAGLVASILAVTIVLIVATWKVFVKAGQPGWAAIVPIYNTVVLLQITGRPIWWVLLMFVPLVNIAIMLVVYMDLGKSFGVGSGFGVGLFFLPFIFFPILGFGNARYLGPAALRPPGPPQPPAMMVYPTQPPR